MSTQTSLVNSREDIRISPTFLIHDAAQVGECAHGFYLLTVYEWWHLAGGVYAHLLGLLCADFQAYLS